MIVPMKRVTLLAPRGEREAVIAELGELGAVHLRPVQPPAAESIDALEAALAAVDAALAHLPVARAGTDPSAATDEVEARIADIRSLAAHCSELDGEREQLMTQRRWFDRWGSVSLESLNALRDSGVHVRFYRAEKKGFGRTLRDDPRVRLCGRDRDAAYLALITDDPEAALDLPEAPMPPVEYADLLARLAANAEAREAVEAALLAHGGHRADLEAHRDDLERRLAVERARHGMGADGPLCYVQGFCPEPGVAALTERVRANGWGIWIDDPGEAHEVPTLVQTPRWVKIIEPVFAFMGTVPGYREYDVSPWFLVFFALFFAMLVGDAGYGALFLLTTALLTPKLRRLPGRPHHLMFVLSGATLVWGALSGNWFGYENLARLPVLSALVVDPLNGFVEANQGFLMRMCFVIAVAQLSLARLLAALRHLPGLKGLAEVGWIAILWAMYFVAGELVLMDPMPAFTLPLFGAGVVLVLFFSHPNRNPFKAMGAALTGLPLDVIGAFSDVVSYIRLFAVGFATLIVAESFNGMALGIGFATVTDGLVAALILFVGHGINIVLALLAVVVHGIRLNMLEFSGHLGMQWSGRPYRPFRNGN